MTSEDPTFFATIHHCQNVLTAAPELERYLLSWELFYESKVLDGASDPARMKAYVKMIRYGFYKTLDPRWHIGTLAVSPKHQRRGIGGKLVEYAQKLAAEENIPLTLESSVVGRRLYQKSGFKTVDESKIAEDLEGISMVWEPDHLKGKWLDDIGDGKANIKGRVTFAKKLVRSARES